MVDLSDRFDALTVVHFTSRLWQIFVDDSKQPGRLVLAKEQPSRPTLDDIDVWILSEPIIIASVLI